MAYYILKIIPFDLIFCIALPYGTTHIRTLKNACIFKKKASHFVFSGRIYRGDGTCSARFLPSYSLSLYAFIFIKGILLLFILCFNSLSRLPLKTRHSRRVFFTRRSSPDTRIKKLRQHIVVAIFLVEVTGLAPLVFCLLTHYLSMLLYS